MPSTEFSVDKRDIQFVLHEQLQVEKLTELEKFQEFDRETFDMILDEAIKFATTELAPINKEGDQVGAVYKEGQVKMPESFHQAYKAYAESGWIGMTMSPEYGGQGFPETIGMAAGEVFTGANASFALTPMLTRGTAHLIEAFGTEELRNLYCEKLYTGEWTGTMCLTEPSAGSDVGALSTRAEPKGDHYLISGTKIFITSGDHDMTDNIIHAVLARVDGGPPGTKGISLFAVPKYLVNEDGSLGEFNDVNCGGIEHKMGIKSSPTCMMNFGDEGKCKGWLLGELHGGMKCMFQMMNEARLGVGLQGSATAATAYLSALGYALDRKQGSDISKFKDPTAPRVPIIRHPDIRRMLLTMKAYSDGLRALLYSTSMFEDYEFHHPDPAKREYYGDLVELLTPICKAYSSDIGFRVCEMAIQTYGGYGYTQEYPVEQYCRDEKIASIYEGTNGIQALDLMARKIAGKGGVRFMNFVGLVNNFVDEHREHALKDQITKLEAGKNLLAEVTMGLMSAAQGGDLLQGVINATPYLELFGNFVTAYFLTEGATIASDKLQKLYEENKISGKEERLAFRQQNTEAAFYYGKICTSDFFLNNVLPLNKGLADAINSKDRNIMKILFLDEEA